MSWAVLQDVTVRYNVIRHACAGISQSAADGGTSLGSQVNSQRPQRILFQDNIFYDLNNPVRTPLEPCQASPPHA